MCPVHECHGYDARPDIALPKYRLCHQLRSVPGDLCRSGHGFTLVEVLVVLLILGVIATIVMLSLAGFLGSGKEESANTEAHQVQSAVIAYMSANNIHSWNGTVDKSGTTDVHSYILNTGRLQAIYTITDGRIASAIAYPDGKWADCTWSPATSQWECGS